jgi:hypothetical protein
LSLETYVPLSKPGTGERDYRLGMVVVRSRGRGKPRSGGGFQGDFVTQCFELADVVTFLGVRTDAGVVEVWAQVVKAGLGVREQVPDDDQDRAPEGDDRSFFAAAAGEASIALSEEGVGFAGGYRGFPERAG